MKKTFKILFLISIVIFAACRDMLEYSPYVIDFDEQNRDVNQNNIEYLLQKEAGSTLRIAFTGDTHRAFDEFEDFVHSVNNLHTNDPIDFVIHVGDIADFGLPQQYLWGNSYLLKLDCPYFVVLGNHDMVGNGGLAYSEMFGKYDFSFIHGDIKFVFINTNSREFNFNGEVPNINWLDTQLQPADDFTSAVVIFHVPPMDADFDPVLQEGFHSGIAKYNNVLFTIHGHLHRHEIYTPYPDDIQYVNVYSAERNKFNVINITDEKFDVETHEF